MNDRSLASAEALLRYRSGNDADPLPVRDLCRRLLNALGHGVASMPAPDARLLATALEMAAARDLAVRNLRNELASLIEPEPARTAPPGSPAPSGTSSPVHVHASGSHGIAIGAGRDVHNTGSIGHVTHTHLPPAGKDESSPGEPAFAVLFAGASPDDQAGLRVDREERALKEALQRGGKRDRIRLESRMAVQPLDFTQALQAVKPRVVHFAGHGEAEGGILFESGDGYSYPATAEALRDLFAQVPGIECVILNACYSRANADAILQAVPWVVGMNGPLHDDSAIVYSTGFYQALVEGRDVPAAHAWGCALMKLMNAEGERPVLDSRP